MADPKISIEEAYEVFKNPAAMDAIPFKSQGFVKSLLAGKAKYGTNSPKQQHWVRVYAEKAQSVINPGNVVLTPLANALKDVVSTPPAPPLNHIVGTALYEMLKKAEDFVFAKGGKKRPQIKFKPSEKSPNTPRVGFKIAGKASKFKGQVMITSGGAYGQSHYYGRIEDGVYHPAPKASTEIQAFVVEFAKDPTKMGTAYGLSTMHCCFCAKAIDTVDSKAMGYGPVCASKFDLPWGKKATKAAGVTIPADATFQPAGTGTFFSPTTKQNVVEVANPDSFKVEASPSKWIEMGDAVEQMQKLAKATGTAVTGVQGFAKAVAATGLTEPIEAEEAPAVIVGIDLAAEAAEAIEMATPEPVAQDFGFTCEVCMDTGKDLTPEGMLVDCGGCK